MTLDEALSSVGPGWSDLIRRYFSFMELLKVPATVTYVGSRKGMLSIKAHSDDELGQDLLTRVAWTFERSSSTVCEVCGIHGWRRKHLAESPSLCFIHYVELLNNLAEKGIL